MTSDIKYREEDVVAMLKDKEHLFPNIGKSSLVFEKAIMQGKTIMDCMLCTENKGVIGIEIKTERDTTYRLNKQLQDYNKVCDYVYVMCHDNHVDKVEDILKHHKHAHVGIIAYTIHKGVPWVGVYKEADKSPLKDVYYTLNILWRSEISDLLGTFKHLASKIERDNPDIKGLDAKNSGVSLPELTRSAIVGRKARKPDLINALVAKLGPVEANKVFCDIMIKHRNDPTKAINIQHFNPKH